MLIILPRFQDQLKTPYQTEALWQGLNNCKVLLLGSIRKALMYLPTFDVLNAKLKGHMSEIFLAGHCKKRITKLLARVCLRPPLKAEDKRVIAHIQGCN